MRTSCRKVSRNYNRLPFRGAITACPWLRGLTKISWILLWEWAPPLGELAAKPTEGVISHQTLIFIPRLQRKSPKPSNGRLKSSYKNKKAPSQKQGWSIAPRFHPYCSQGLPLECLNAANGEPYFGTHSAVVAGSEYCRDFSIHTALWKYPLETAFCINVFNIVYIL